MNSWPDFVVSWLVTTVTGQWSLNDRANLWWSSHAWLLREDGQGPTLSIPRVVSFNPATLPRMKPSASVSRPNTRWYTTVLIIIFYTSTYMRSSCVWWHMRSPAMMWAVHTLSFGYTQLQQSTTIFSKFKCQYILQMQFRNSKVLI